MKLVLLFLTIIGFASEVIVASPLIKLKSIGLDLTNRVNENFAIETLDERKGRSSPVGSIAGYITNYQEKKKLKHHTKQHYNKNQASFQKPKYEQPYSKKPVYHPKPTKASYYQKNQRHCFYGHIFVRC